MWRNPGFQEDGGGGLTHISRLNKYKSGASHNPLSITQRECQWVVGTMTGRNKRGSPHPWGVRAQPAAGAPYDGSAQINTGSICVSSNWHRLSSSLLHRLPRNMRKKKAVFSGWREHLPKGCTRETFGIQCLKLFLVTVGRSVRNMLLRKDSTTPKIYQHSHHQIRRKTPQSGTQSCPINCRNRTFDQRSKTISSKGSCWTTKLPPSGLPLVNGLKLNILYKCINYP